MKKIIFCLLAVAFFACKKDEPRQIDASYKPDVSASKFSTGTVFTNKFLPFEAGKTYIFEGQTEDGLERIEVRRRSETKTILGIGCIVINDRAWLNGILIEETDDWYAQDNDGNVWYFGETVKNYNPDGSFKDTGGSWEAGVDGAQPGIAMLADPKPGMKYRQEYYFNEAEDEGEVLETALTVTCTYGTFEGCVKTHDFTALEPDLNEHKFYAPGIGVIKEVNVADNETIQLIEIK